MVLVLSIIRCPDRAVPEQRRVQGGEYSLGRGAECDWVLNDPDRVLSKRHCAVEFLSGAWQVRDLSTNGTFVNSSGEPLGRDRTKELRDGDRLRLGAYEIECRVEDEAVYGSGRWQSANAIPDPMAPPPVSDIFSVPLPGLSPAGGTPGGHAPLLPADFDPFAPDDPGPVMPDHRPSTSDVFTPPRATMPDLLPDDWAAPPKSPASAFDALPDPFADAPPGQPAPRPPAATPPLAGASPSAAARPDPFATPPPARLPDPFADVSAPLAASPLPDAFADGPFPSAAAPRTDPKAASLPDPFMDASAPAGAAPLPDPPPEAAPLPDPFAEMRPPRAIATPAAPLPDPFAELSPAAPTTPDNRLPDPFADLGLPAVSAPPVAESPFAALDVPAVPPSALPPPVAFAPPPLAPAPPVETSGGGGMDGALALLFQSAGLPPPPPGTDAAAALTAAGAALRASVAGMRALLIARADVKREFRIEQTMLRAAGNNPVKFAATDDQAVQALLSPKANGPAAMRETVQDLTAHQIATLAATQAAARALLTRLAPGPLEAETPSGGIMPGAKEKALWTAYKKLHQQVIDQFEDDFDSAFGKAFARAYEEAARG